MPTMRLSEDSPARDVRRGAFHYKAEPGGTVEASGRDIEFLERQGFVVIDAEGGELSGLKTADLRARVKELGIADVPRNATREQLVTAIANHEG